MVDKHEKTIEDYKKESEDHKKESARISVLIDKLEEQLEKAFKILRGEKIE